MQYFTSCWITPPPKSSKLNAAPPPPIAAFGIKGCASPPARPFSFPVFLVVLALVLVVLALVLVVLALVLVVLPLILVVLIVYSDQRYPFIKSYPIK
ncbi:hypothetical protein [Bartonella apis]|uniref:hypothetical protein n=1 Tax=Bartonella apis TaxID=1686310 RepID=UPI003BB5227F